MKDDINKSQPRQITGRLKPRNSIVNCRNSGIPLLTGFICLTRMETILRWFFRQQKKTLSLLHSLECLLGKVRKGSRRIIHPSLYLALKKNAMNYLQRTILPYTLSAVHCRLNRWLTTCRKQWKRLKWSSGFGKVKSKQYGPEFVEHHSAVLWNKWC